jgi:hypothetical protein
MRNDRNNVSLISYTLVSPQTRLEREAAVGQELLEKHASAVGILDEEVRKCSLIGLTSL